MAKVLYPKRVKGKLKPITEIILIKAIDYADVQYTLTELLMPRMPNLDIDAVKKDHCRDVYKMTVDGRMDVWEGQIYRMEIAFYDGIKWSKDIHYVNAETPEIAIQRVHIRLNECREEYRIVDTKETKIAAIHDRDDIVFVEDFRYRQEDLIAEGHVAYDVADAMAAAEKATMKPGDQYPMFELAIGVIEQKIAEHTKAIETGELDEEEVNHHLDQLQARQMQLSQALAQKMKDELGVSVSNSGDDGKANES